MAQSADDTPMQSISGQQDVGATGKTENLTKQEPLQEFFHFQKQQSLQQQSQQQQQQQQQQAPVATEKQQEEVVIDTTSQKTTAAASNTSRKRKQQIPVKIQNKTKAIQKLAPVAKTPVVVARNTQESDNRKTIAPINNTSTSFSTINNQDTQQQSGDTDTPTFRQQPSIFRQQTASVRQLGPSLQQLIQVGLKRAGAANYQEQIVRSHQRGQQQFQRGLASGGGQRQLVGRNGQPIVMSSQQQQQQASMIRQQQQQQQPRKQVTQGTHQVFGGANRPQFNVRQNSSAQFARFK